MSKSKSKLFSTSGKYGYKFNGKYGKLNAAERGALLMQKKDMSKKLTSSERKDVNAYIKYRQKDITEKVNKIDPREKSKYISVETAKSIEINSVLSDNELDNMQKAMDVYMSQEQFYNEYMEDADYLENRDYTSIGKALEEDDKWRLLRKLAEVDKRLNYDRAYASETLKDIEDMIEEHKGVDFDTAFSQLLFDHQEEIRKNNEWNEDLQPFRRNDDDIETKALINNKGFHGTKKAMEKWARENSPKSSNLADYSPAYFEV